MSSIAEPVGFVGLGNMGSVLAKNLVRAGHVVEGCDSAGPERVPEGVRYVRDVAGIAQRCEVVVLSLPDGRASDQVARDVIAAPDRRTTLVVDTSTIGVAMAKSIDGLLADSGIAYVDAPVSGGVAGARARTLMIMYAGTDEACFRVKPVVDSLSERHRRVGEAPGMAQAMKLANNFLSATALAATSEAISFGLSVGLDMETMLEVLNASSGQSAATTEKFPNQVLTGQYASGFANSLMAKDLSLYVQAAEDKQTPSLMSSVTLAIWERFAGAEPGVDFTRIFPFVQGM